MNEDTDRLSRRKKRLILYTVVLLVSTGLCGLNLKLMNTRAGFEDGILWVTGMVEMGGMLIGAVGVIVTLVMLTIDWIETKKKQ